MPTELELLTGLSNSAPTLVLVLLAFLGGVTVPFPYAMERFRGFGRIILSKLPYKPPAGMKTEEAMQATTGEDTEADSHQ